MSYKEAKRDGVRISVDSAGYPSYFPKCHICGNEVYSWSYKPEFKYKCKDCKQIKTALIEEIDKDISRDEQEHKLGIALEKLAKQTDIKKYSKAIETIKKSFGTPKWYQSSEEVMTALELIRRGIEAHHQVKVGRYRVDFVLPKEKIVLEIDGKLFHTADTKEKEQTRDNIIIMSLGYDWEVIRISTDYINQNVKQLYKAITELKKQRRRVRELNNGQLPAWQTDNAI